MYAVIMTGGKQHRVTAGETLQIEKLEAEEGAAVTFDQVLLVSTDSGLKIGNPVLSGAKVTGKVVEQGRGPKIIVFRKKKTKTFRRTRGHRQYLTTVRIESIQA